MSSRDSRGGGGGSRRGRGGRPGGHSPRRGRGDRGAGQSRGSRSGERSPLDVWSGARGSHRGGDRDSSRGTSGGSAQGDDRGRDVAATSNVGSSRDTNIRADHQPKPILTSDKEDDRRRDPEAQPGSSRGARDRSQQGGSARQTEKLLPITEEYEQQPIGYVQDLPGECPMSTEQLENVQELLNKRIDQLEYQVQEFLPTAFKTLRLYRELAKSKSQNKLADHANFLHKVCRSLQADVGSSRSEEDLQRRAAWLTEAVSSLEARLNISEERRWLMKLDFKVAQSKAKEALEVVYPGGSLKLWEDMALGQEPKYPSLQQSKDVVWERIDVWARREKVWNIDIDSLLQSDLEWCRTVCSGGQDQKAESGRDKITQSFLTNGEVAAFIDPDSKTSNGMLVMGASTPKDPSSPLPNVMLEVVELLRERPNTAVLTHAVERRNSIDAQIDDVKWKPLTGVVGFLRSICSQLIRWCLESKLEIDWQKINEDDSLTHDPLRLCRSFRSMLLALAIAAAANRTRYAVVVIADDIHVLERNWEFAFVVSFFRAICDETYFGDLGGAITFKYMFLHPSFSLLLEMPHVAENFVLYPFRTFAEADNNLSTSTAQLEQPITKQAIESSAPRKDPVKEKAVSDRGSSTSRKEPVKPGAVSSRGSSISRKEPAKEEAASSHSSSKARDKDTKADKGKKAQYLEKVPGSSAVAKIIGTVDGFPSGTIIEESQIEKAMGAVKNHILALRANLDVSLQSQFEEIEKDFKALQAKQSDRTARLKDTLDSVFQTELSSLSAKRSAATQALQNGVLNAINLLTARNDFALLRHWMMKIEFLSLRVDQSSLPLMEYPGSNISVWAPRENDKKPQLPPSSRRQILDSCLTGSEDAKSPAHIAAMDFTYCYKDIPAIVPQETNLASRISHHLDNKELTSFRKLLKSGGLLIQGCNLHMQTTPRAWSHTSHLLATYIRGWGIKRKGKKRRLAIVLRHSAGFRNTTKDQVKSQMLSGVDGLMRSLCMQLIDYPNTHFGLEFMETLEQAQHARLQVGEIGALCGLWRELLINAIDATHDSQTVNGRLIIIVAIDGIEWFEAYNSGSFAYVIEFFRALCDEMNGANLLGGAIIFKYILVHAGFSQLLAKPHAGEQVVVCTFDQVADRNEKAMPGGSQSHEAAKSTT